jgi:hypothetical protein
MPVGGILTHMMYMVPFLATRNPRPAPGATPASRAPPLTRNSKPRLARALSGCAHILIWIYHLLKGGAAV